MSNIKELAGNSVGIEVSNSIFKSVALSANNELVGSEIYNLQDSENYFTQLVHFILQLKDKYGDFQKIGIAVPGLVNYQTNRVALSTQMPEHAEVDFTNHLKAETGLEVVVENDANAGAYGEYILGAGRNSQDMFYVTLGTGVGGAIILKGEIWRGTSGFAGEFGYMTIDSEGLKLEEVASTSSIIRRIRNRFHQDQTSSLVSIGEENFTIGDVVREANKGDGFSQMMLQRTGMFVGTGVASVINLLNIERIIVGGEAMDDEGFLLNAIIERSKELSFEPAFETTQILAGELKDLASATGAALLANRADKITN